MLIPPHPASPSAPPASPTEGRGVIFFPLASAVCLPPSALEPLSPPRKEGGLAFGQAG
ncbi:MAG: hypothetical protein NZ602_00640 [Thermoguttaceae bacterium]|nr:hypothetical protein [Thermoguttaceae bacterium]